MKWIKRVLELQKEAIEYLSKILKEKRELLEN